MAGLVAEDTIAWWLVRPAPMLGACFPSISRPVADQVKPAILHWWYEICRSYFRRRSRLAFARARL
jgi:hypothetical protein